MNAELAFREWLSSPVVIAVVATFATIYTSTVAPDLPGPVKALFDSPVFRVAVIFLTAYMASARKPGVALVSAVAFMVLAEYAAAGTAVERFVAARDKKH